MTGQGDLTGKNGTAPCSGRTEDRVAVAKGKRERRVIASDADSEQEEIPFVGLVAHILSQFHGVKSRANLKDKHPAHDAKGRMAGIEATHQGKNGGAIIAGADAHFKAEAGAYSPAVSGQNGFGKVHVIRGHCIADAVDHG